MRTRNVLVALALLLAGAAHAHKPDLSGATPIVLEAYCRFGTEKFPCSLVEKEGIRYVVLLDDTGEGTQAVIILQVRAGASPPYKASDYTVIWSQDDDEKMAT